MSQPSVARERRWRRPSIAAQTRQVEAWNRKHPIGTPVAVQLDSGEIKLTLTRSEAQMLSGHTAVIFLSGISGAYLLSRVQPTGQAVRA